MASIYDLKPKFQGLLRPLCRALANAGVSANQVTLGALLLSLVAGAGLFVTKGGAVWLMALPAVLFIRMAMNAIDGMLAREFGQQSRLGAVLNELCDVMSDAALYLPFAVIAGLNGALVVGAVILGVIAEMTGVIAVQIGAGRRYDGPFGKSDRALFFGLLAVLIGAGVTPGLWSDGALALACLLGAATMINRARAALSAAQHGDAGIGKHDDG